MAVVVFYDVIWSVTQAASNETWPESTRVVMAPKPDSTGVLLKTSSPAQVQHS